MARILTLQDLAKVHGRVAIDVETFGGHAPHLGELAGLGVWSEDSGVIGYIPGEWTPALREVILNWPEGTWLIGHNLKYELRWLHIEQHHLSRFRMFDTAVAEHLINENLSKDLGSLETRYFKTKTKRAILDGAAKEGYSIKDVSEWPVQLLAEYCVNDVRITYQVAQLQGDRLRKEGVANLFQVQMDYLKVLHGAERYGMLIDLKSFDRVQNRLLTGVGYGERDLRLMLDKYGWTDDLNYRSAHQVSRLLYEHLGLEKPVVPEELKFTPKAAKYTKTATGKDILKRLNHEVPKRILMLKALQTVNGYFQSYRKLSHRTKHGLVLHPDFNMTGTVTGRLSSSNPNVQQIKNGLLDLGGGRTVDARNIFHARPGSLLVSVDYSQMEAAVFGALANDPDMLKLVREGGDIHAASARLIFGEYNPETRRVAKTVNFGILYGLGQASLANDLGVSISESAALLAKYMQTFKRVRPFMREVEEELSRKGYVRYWSGRKRRLPKRQDHYKGVNSVIQGGCADVVARAAIEVDKLLQANDSHLVAIIHDELVMEIPKDSVEDLLPHIRKTLSVEEAFGIPLNTEALVGPAWRSK